MNTSSSTAATSHSADKRVLSCFVLLFLSAFSVTLNAQTTNPIVAKVGGQIIRQDEIDDTVSSQVYALQQQLFAVRKTVLESLISRKLLEAEAKRQKLTIEQLKSNWMAGPIMVEQAQVDDLYSKNRSAFGLMNPDEAKEKLRLDLEGQGKLKRYREALNALRQKTQVVLLLEEPRLTFPLTSRATSSKGPANAKVIITEFSDYQCPYCKEAQVTLARVLEKYPADVKLQFKNLPLEIHPFAFQAARAAYCSEKQNAFWDFHDALFEAKELSANLIQAIALKINLDIKDFETCLSSQESYAAVADDLQEAQRLGIKGTPSFVINGKLLVGLPSLAEFDNAIRRELNRVSTQTSTSLR